MRLLVLDLATHLGFCFGDEAGVIEHGSHILPSTGPDIGAFLHAYAGWLGEKLMSWPIEKIVFEMPILGTGANLATLRKLYSLCGLTELIAKTQGLPCGEANLTDIRRHFIGVCRAPKETLCSPGCSRKKCGRCSGARRAWLKHTTIAACRRLGFSPSDDNDADALALFSFCMSSADPAFILAGDEIARAA